VVFAHGSGDATRNVGAWNLFFVRLGFAVLSLDKRGAGASGGDWRTASLDQIADDWLAGVNYLKQRPEIDTHRIGVHASSQGGWTAPLMAARSKDIAFLIVRAGSGVNVLDTMAYEVQWSVRDAGFSAAQGEAAAAAARELFQIAARRAPWPEFEAAAKRYQQEPWADAAWPLFMTESGWGREWTALNAHYDNADALSELQIPVLWFLADNDHNLSSSESEPRLLAAKAKSGNPHFTVVKLTDASHGFTATKTGNSREFPQQTHMAVGYWDTMRTWLRERGFSPLRRYGDAR
jgi:pimeloyl-ACP methyl ester carboxylesterase